MTQAACDGLLVLDKPGGLTSRAALDHAARWFPRHTRVGHAGTLDPLATGVLVLCIGSATRLTEYVQQMNKTYQSRFRLGARSDTDDADGTITPLAGVTPPEPATVAARLAEWVGTVAQVPPAFSAAKVMGRRAYDLARKGEAVVLTARPVRVDAIAVERYDYPVLDVEVHCGKGTYIRSLARDLGDRLGCGAYVETLRRTRIGPFTTAAAVSLHDDPAVAHGRLLPVASAVGELARVTLPPEAVRRFCRGQAVALADIPSGQTAADVFLPVAVFDADERLLAVAEYDPACRLLRPTKVLVAG